MNRALLLLLALLAASCRTLPPQPPEPEDKGKAREKWFFEQRAYPFGTIPVDARRNALAQIERFRAESNGAQSDAANASVWRAIGPLPVWTYWPWSAATGRVKALAVSPVNPDLILAGSSSGGIWRSLDGGEHFAPVSDEHADLAVGAIAFAPSHPNIVYATMGSDFLGTGILRSDDAGAHWRLVSGPTYGALGTARRLIIDPANPERLWVAQYSRLNDDNGIVYASGVLHSEDGGVTWTKRFAGLVSDLVALPGSATTFLLGLTRNDQLGGGSSGIYRTTDAGETWTPIQYFTPGSRAYPRIAVSPASPQRVYAHVYEIAGEQEKFHFLVSDDGGMSWRSNTALGLAREFSVFVHADPSNANVVYVGLRDLYKSSDGGLTFRNATMGYTNTGRFDPANSTSHVDQHSMAFHPQDSRILWLGNDGGVFRSRDGAATFESQSETLPLVQAYGIAAHPTDPALLFLGTQDNGLERRNPSGSWFELITGDYGSILFDANDPERFITNYVYGTIMTFGDRGDDYIDTVAHSGTFGEGPIAFIAPFEQSRATNTLYFGTWRLFLSRNFGGTWIPPAGALDLTKGEGDSLSAIGISSSHPATIYTGSGRGRVMVTRDEGVTWSDVTSGLPDRSVRAIAIDQTNPDVAYVGFSGYAASHVWRTNNGGTSWESINDGLPDTPVNALLIDRTDANVLYAGTDIGVFRYDARFAKWEYFSRGMPPVIVTDFDVTADGRIVAATHGRGAYELIAGPPPSPRRRSVRK